MFSSGIEGANSFKMSALVFAGLATTSTCVYNNQATKKCKQFGYLSGNGQEKKGYNSATKKHSSGSSHSFKDTSNFGTESFKPQFGALKCFA